MKRILCLFFPFLLADLQKKKISKTNQELLNKPLLFASRLHNEDIVARYCSLAKEYGVSVGVPLSVATAHIPEALVFHYEQLSEQKALKRICSWAYQFSSLCSIDSAVETTPLPDIRSCGITIDITASLRLFRGEERLILLILHSLQSFNLHVRLAIAPSYASAWALSRYHKLSRISTEMSSLRQELAELPVAALRLSPPAEEALRDVQIQKLKELFSITPSSLFTRFGPEITTRLSQFFGEEELFTPLIPTNPLQVTENYNSPLQNRARIETAAQKLLTKLLDKLESSQNSLLSLTFTLRFYRNPPFVRSINLHAPSLDQAHIFSLIRYQLEATSFAEGACAITLEAAHISRLCALPANDLIDPEAFTPQQDEGVLLDTLQQLVGSEHILKLTSYESNIPEQAYSYEPLSSKLQTNDSKATIANRKRPSIIFPSPHKISALSLLPDNPPQAITWDKRLHKVISGIGPERISPEWWKQQSDAHSRDYFALQLSSGTWLWTYRDIETSEWFIHGIWV